MTRQEWLISFVISSCSLLLRVFLPAELVVDEFQVVVRGDVLRILDEHLLSTSNLTKFFKELKPSSCRSSVSSESRHLYKNPLLGQALDLLRRGRKEDERGNFGGALVFYESGLASLFVILR